MSAETPTQEAVILDAQRIERCIQRIARQIFEDHHNAAQMTVAAVDGQGTVLARRISGALRGIASNAVMDCTLILDKDNPLDHAIDLVSEDGGNLDLASLSGSVVIVVDDVLNSGRTLLHAVSHFLPARPAHVGTCVLVDRIHRRFPVRADYVGKSLSTNLKAHIDVRLSGPGPDEAVLMA